jgi:RNA-binding protein
MALTSSRKSELRALAHELAPVVIIGDKGLTDEVVAEIDRALKAHELIKVRAASADRDLRGQWMGAICERLAAHPVQQIGKVLVVYREDPEKRKVTKAEGSELKRTGRRQSRTVSRPPESAPRRRRPRSSR